VKYIEELVAYKKDIDAIQIAEILWLSQFMGSESSEVEENLESITDILKQKSLLKKTYRLLKMKHLNQ